MNAPCLDCGEPWRLSVKDGAILAEEPAGIFGYIDIPFNDWRLNRPHS